MTDDREDKHFWAMLTHKRDEGLAHITGVIERSGVDEFCGFLSKHVMPESSREHAEDPDNVVGHVIAHMAIIGAADALLAWKDRQDAESA